MASSGIGHNRGGRRSMYAIVFDFDQETLRNTYNGNSPNNADFDIRKYLTARGFDWMQGSTYFGNEFVDAVRCVTVVQRMARKFPWFTPSATDFRMLRIEENNDLKLALDDEEIE